MSQVMNRNVQQARDMLRIPAGTILPWLQPPGLAGRAPDHPDSLMEAVR